LAFLSKYGVARHVYIPIVKRAVVDFALSADWTPAAGDVKISKDGGAAANVTNLPAAIAMGNTAMWDFSLTATEMQAAQIMVTVADSATKAVEDQMFVIETYGNASGQHAFDLGTATQSVNVSSINGVAASSVTTINANIGTTQPINFTGTGASALAKSDMVDIAGAAVSTASAQIGVNIINAAGTAWGSGAITAGSIAAAAMNGKGDWNVGKTGYSLSAAGISAIWQDTTASDFTAVGSIGKSIMNGVALGTGLTVNDITTKTGYSLTQTFPANFSSLAITVGGAVTAGTVSDKTGYALTAAYDPAKTASQAGDAMALTAAYDFAKGTVAITESYRANGAAPTPVQALCEMLAHLGESAISGTTKTVNKFDHVTAAETFTLDDATNPTSVTRAT
jgi:hypothetical protein